MDGYENVRSRPRKSGGTGGILLRLIAFRLMSVGT